MLYSLYAANALVHWSPGMIFQNEVRVRKLPVTGVAVLHSNQILTSFAQSHCFSRAVAYLESGKLNVKGMVCDYYYVLERVDSL